ncbi:hypothetical protein [Ottowia sp.]|uniref:hypothetical protein n=1 Tax=Ottowia sp. TaxID=1898956 RepID=UPI002BEDDA69|nr:hypothetical protein [Ottowia sp.]HOB65534.1 hypothetical protein [Ottowia sp.]HPZ58138.1 hypothetical protein [Ottowia sp.]HQD48075.1 hypothetical protein [Ottowia sp.]
MPSSSSLAIRHLLIPGAAPQTDAGAALPPLPALPNLQALVRQLRVADTITCDADGAAHPHELAAARANGLPGDAGRIPWAAFESGTVGTPCAWLRPVHIQIGMDSVQLIGADEMALADADSQALAAACSPLLAHEGITVAHALPAAWLARGELLRHVVAPGAAHAAGQPLTRASLPHDPNPERQRRLARLQSELEMLLATHPVNAAREAARQWPVNMLWIDGAGALDAPLPPRPDVWVAPHLCRGDAARTARGHAAAWQAIDAEHAAPLLAALRAGQPVKLTLSGPRRAITLAPAAGLWHRVSSLFAGDRLQSLRDQL